MINLRKLLRKINLLFLVTGTACLFCTGNGIAQQYVSASGNIPTKNVSYEAHVKPIINNYCIACHSGKSPSAGLNLTSYKNVRYKTEKGNLLERINNDIDPMPMGNIMPENERLLIEKWAKNNFREKSDSQTVASQNNKVNYQFNPPAIKPVNINQKGFQFFDQMQGHWVGKMTLMGQKIPWFAFDYRPIAPSHVHGIFEGGSMGNLLTSFFIADFKGVKTIMARNGGVLNGIYRISYFLLDKVKITPNESYYRFVDAYGGKQIMWMELKFKGNKLTFNSYTSRFGAHPKPKAHMVFTAKKTNPELAANAAKQVKFPQNRAEKSFPQGLPMPNWGQDYPTITSATYFWKDASLSVEAMAKLAGDPYRIDQIPYLSSLKLKFAPGDKNKKVQVYLSKEPLTNTHGKLIMAYGYIKEQLMNKVLLFPELAKAEDFTLTYLHPGTYYLTVIIDKNGDSIPSKGDISNRSQKIVVKPSSRQEVLVNAIEVQN